MPASPTSTKCGTSPDLAAVMENETVWGQFKQRLSPSELVQIPLPVLKNVGIGLLTTWLKSQF
jgi:hypothetical protein